MQYIELKKLDDLGGLFKSKMKEKMRNHVIQLTCPSCNKIAGTKSVQTLIFDGYKTLTCKNKECKEKITVKYDPVKRAIQEFERA